MCKQTAHTGNYECRTDRNSSMPNKRQIARASLSKWGNSILRIIHWIVSGIRLWMEIILPHTNQRAHTSHGLYVKFHQKMIPVLLKRVKSAGKPCRCSLEQHMCVFLFYKSISSPISTGLLSFSTKWCRKIWKNFITGEFYHVDVLLALSVPSKFESLSSHSVFNSICHINR